MAAKRVKNKPFTPTLVDFHFEERTYQIDPDRRKVYRRFVEIETSKASEIMSSWRAQEL